MARLATDVGRATVLRYDGENIPRPSSRSISRFLDIWTTRDWTGFCSAQDPDPAGAVLNHAKT